MHETVLTTSGINHNITVYANNTIGNMGRSATIFFRRVSGGGGGRAVLR